MKTFFNLLLAYTLMAAFPAHAAEKRVALVIGNSAYPSGALDNPRNDATAIATAFKRLGFDVDLKIDVTKADFDAAMKRLSNKADKADVAVLFYAGHGIQVNNYNYLVPVDAKPQNERDLKREMVKLDDMIDDMGNARVKLVFFDACRDNPMARSFHRGGSRGLAAPLEATGTLISFATKHGNTAADGEGKHSPYTEVLLTALENPEEEVHALLRKKVQQGVKQKTGGQQEPWTYGNLNGDFYFIQGPVNITVYPPAKPEFTAPVRMQSAAEIEQELWNSIKDANSPDALAEYLKAYPKGRYTVQAKVLIAKYKKSAVIAQADTRSDDPESALWRAVENSNSADDYLAYLGQYPKGKYVALAKSRIEKLKEQAAQEARKRDEVLWQAAESGASEITYQDYLAAYPNGYYAALAKSRLKKLQEDRAAREEQDLWKTAEDGSDKLAVNAYLTRYPAGKYVAAARIKLIRIEKEEAEMKPGRVFKDCTECPEMVVLPTGSFQMGGNKNDSEKPVHTVTITKPFAMGKTEVTQGQWRAIMGENSSNFKNCGDACPVENVNWNEAQEFIKKLNAKTGQRYRLPAEAEWEYACHAGGTHTYCGGNDLDAVAWYGKNSGNTTHPVARKQANAWGLYDMSGNVWEWVEDCWNASYSGAPTDGSAWTSGVCTVRVLRGGSWGNGPQLARAANRGGYDTADRDGDFGFRLARMLP